MTSEALAQWVNSFPGPRLLIVNTVQSATVIAKTIMQLYGRNRVEHLSTALTARDRARTLARVRQRLRDPSDCDWTLVATSCVEAGVDFSFSVGFRETASLSSLLQASGRVNRNGKTKNALMWSFGLNYADDALLKEHPIIKHAATVLTKEFLEKTVRFFLLRLPTPFDWNWPVMVSTRRICSRMKTACPLSKLRIHSR